MIKNLARLECVIEGKVGHFLLDHDASIAVAKEMCLQFLKYLGQIEDAAKAQMEAQKENAPVEEEIKPS